MPCNSPRNLDISALRSFVTVAELGGVTRAAERLNLTQSAVSMQLKRLETAFDQPLMQRHGRGVCLTSEGEQLLGYGRRDRRFAHTALAGDKHRAPNEELREPMRHGAFL